MREKLIELLDKVQHHGNSTESSVNYVYNSAIADHLIANDVVPVVRCEKCRLAKTICNDYVCCLTGMPMDADSFCSYGERKDNGDLH